MKNERRYFVIEGLQVEKRENENRKIKGHAAVFNTEADIGWFREKILPGAFKDSIGADDIRALFNHDSNYVLGRNRANTLILSEDDRGLAVEIDPPDTQWARDLEVSIDRGDITQMSFGFRVERSEDESWENGEKGQKDLRILKRVKLYDVSPVTYPAYPETDVAVRSHEAWKERSKPLTYKPFMRVLRQRKSELKIGAKI